MRIKSTIGIRTGTGKFLELAQISDFQEEEQVLHGAHSDPLVRLIRCANQMRHRLAQVTVLRIKLVRIP